MHEPFDVLSSGKHPVELLVSGQRNVACKLSHGAVHSAIPKHGRLQLVASFEYKTQCGTCLITWERTKRVTAS